MNDGRIRPGKIALEQAQRKALAAEKAAAFAQKKHLWALQELKAARARHAATLHNIEMEAYRRQYNKRANRRRMRNPKTTEFENISFISGPKETPRMTKTAKLRIHTGHAKRAELARSTMQNPRFRFDMDVKFLRSNPLYAVNRQTPRVTPKVYVRHGPYAAWVDENTNTWQKQRRQKSRSNSVTRRSTARRTPLALDSGWRRKSPRSALGVRSTRSAELRRMSSLRKLGHVSDRESEDTGSDQEESWPRPPMTVQRERQYMSRYRAAFEAEKA